MPVLAEWWRGDELCLAPGLLKGAVEPTGDLRPKKRSLLL